jgi:hypothetical protein
MSIRTTLSSIAFVAALSLGWSASVRAVHQPVTYWNDVAVAAALAGRASPAKSGQPRGALGLPEVPAPDARRRKVGGGRPSVTPEPRALQIRTQLRAPDGPYTS